MLLAVYAMVGVIATAIELETLNPRPILIEDIMSDIVYWSIFMTSRNL